MKRLIAIAIAASALVGTAAPVQADFYSHKASFAGSGTTGAFVQPENVAVNYEDGSVLVLDRGKAAPVSQYDLEGNPKPFSALAGNNSLGAIAIGNRIDIAVDNSGTASQGNIYVESREPERIYGFDADGTPLPGFPVTDVGVSVCAVWTAPDGNFWVAESQTEKVIEYTPAGVRTGVSYEGTSGCYLAFDSVKRFYTEFEAGPVGHGGSSMRVYGPVLGEWKPLFVAVTDRGFDLDPSNDEVFVNNAKVIVHLDKQSAELGRFGDFEDFPPFYPGMVSSYDVAVDANTKQVYATDPNQSPPSVEIFALRPPLAPKVTTGTVSQLRSTNAIIRANVNPSGGDTQYAIEYGTDTTYGSEVGPADGLTIRGTQQLPVLVALNGLKPQTVYHFRVVAENSTSRSVGPDQEFITYAASPSGDDCTNALVRKQTGAGFLADCRAYELASAADTGGYNVRSDLVPGDTPLPGHPEAVGPSKLLYTLESGSIPGTGTPTSFPGDPYVSVRGETGWETKYVGLPSDINPLTAPFASTLSEGDAGLNTFAFAGDELCKPCFSDGKTGIPVRRSDGSLVQGMAGSQDPGPSAEPDILVRKRLSDDGSHLVFGSTSKFELDAPSGPAVYLRDLAAASTEVASKLPDGSNIPCTMECATKGVAGLDVDDDGSRIVVGQLVGTNPAGADLWHPYVYFAGTGESVDLAPAATEGVLYYGMTRDGGTAFISSAEQLTDDDDDTSVDAYRADVTPSGATLTLISPGDGSGTDCDPLSDPVHEHWNTAGVAQNCDVVPVAGGGGIGEADGSFYFLSPELLETGKGLADAPNLYLAKPSGEVDFVATLESNLNVPADPSLRRPLVGEVDGFTEPTQLAVDRTTKYFYVLDSSDNTVSRFDEDGDPVPFPFAAPYVSGNTLTGTSAASFGLEPDSMIYVDRSGGVRDGFIYVSDPFGSEKVDAFKQSGEFVGSFYAGGTPCGIAMGPLDGQIYAVGSYETAIYKPEHENPEEDTYVAGFSTQGACQTVIDGGGNFYRQFPSGGPVKKYNPKEARERENPVSTTVAETSTAMNALEGSDEILIGHGTYVDQVAADGSTRIAEIGIGDLGDTRGVAGRSGGFVYASDLSDGSVKIFGQPEPRPDPAISSTRIAVRGVEEPDVLHSEDIQVEPSGGSAAFVSAMPLTEAVVGQKRQVFRYDASSRDLDCASCIVTRVAPLDEARLAPFGNSLASGGRVFFSTAEPLALRDANAKRDVYQWSRGEGQELVSPGDSQFDSTLLSVSRDGVDVFFFTRDTLVPQDRNGDLMKIYDARADSGFLVPAARVPCAASDECHGPGTEPPPPVDINTVGDKTRKGGNVRKGKCPKGKVRKKGKCVKKKKRKKRGHR